jgi:2-oxoglutarate ferredoxin oxidoreductase subunit gamma
MSRYELRLSGAGGQGMLLAGLILSEAAGVYDGKFVTQTRSYGPEARGGASKSEVVISTEEIDYPKVMEPDLLLAMTQEAHDKYCGDLKKDAMLIVDSFYVDSVSREGAISVPITSIARERLGRELFANTISLGIIVALTGVVTRDAIEKAVLARAPKGTEQKNRDALKIGFEVAQKHKHG